MRNTQMTNTWLRGQAASGSTSWSGLCLKLQRTARDIPARYPSAISAAYATPKSHRVTNLSDVKRGMVAYFDDPHDSNPYGHIVEAWGRNKTGELMYWSNDVAGRGRVSLVRHSFFKQYWGDSFLFAADWLNGYELDMPDTKPKAKPKPLAGHAEEIQDAIKILKDEIAYHRRKNHPRLVKALERDVTHLNLVLKKFGGIE